MKKLTTILLAVTATLLLSACGGGSSGGDTSTTPTAELSPSGGGTTPPQETDGVLLSIHFVGFQNINGVAAIGQEVQMIAAGHYSMPDDSGADDRDITNLVTWKSSDVSVATIDSNGKLTAISLGKVSIEATLDGVVGESRIIEIVPPYLAEIVITPSEKIIKVSETFQLSIKGVKTDGSVVPVDVRSWFAGYDGFNFVSVDPDDGTVVGLKEGIATILVTLSDEFKDEYKDEFFSLEYPRPTPSSARVIVE